MVTKNFRLSEFKVSKAYPPLADEIEFTEQDKLKIFYLCAMFLQPIRDKYGKVIITSGKRSPALNEAIPGSNNSDHLYTQGTAKAAVDFTLEDVKSAYEDLVNHWPAECYGQIIYYLKEDFIHLSLPTEDNQGETWINE